MTPRPERGAEPPLVLHVLPIDLFRGAQTYARELRLRLDGRGARHRTLTLFASPGGALEADDALAVPPGRARRAGLDPRAVWRLRRRLAALRPDVVVAHGGEPLKYAVLAGVSRRRLVYYKIGGDDARLTGAHLALHRWLVGRAGAVATVSERAATEVIELGVPAARVTVVPNGRDPRVFRQRVHADDGAAPALVWVGQFDATKRPDRFVALVEALRTEGAALGAAMAGTGAALDALRPAAGSAGVELLGTVDDVAELLARSDIFVFTGGPPEGMPGVLIEAGLAGLPVVTTDVPGAADVVVSGSTGTIVPVDDFAALLAATRVLVGDAPRRREWGAAARARCAERFSLDASAERWRALLEEMFDEPCASST